MCAGGSSGGRYQVKARYQVRANPLLSGGAWQVSLYTILSLPILYGVCQTKGETGGGHTLHNGREMVLQ